MSTSSHQYLNFQQVRRESGLTSGDVAKAADVSLTEEYLFEIGGIVPVETREKIIQAFSRLRNHPYTLADFEAVCISPEEPVVLETPFPALPPMPHTSVKGAKHGKQYLH